MSGGGLSEMYLVFSSLYLVDFFLSFTLWPCTPRQRAERLKGALDLVWACSAGGILGSRMLPACSSKLWEKLAAKTNCAAQLDFPDLTSIHTRRALSSSIINSHQKTVSGQACNYMIPIDLFLFLLVEEFFGTRYQNGSIFLTNVGSDFHCLRSFIFFFSCIYS
jgi:hypothetical protein